MSPVADRVDPIARPAADRVYLRLQREIIDSGLCTHCGTCVGLSGGSLRFQDTPNGPLPFQRPKRTIALPEAAYTACPGKGLNYPELNRQLFGSPPESWLSGHVRKCYIGFASDEEVRRGGASGGVTTQILLNLLRVDRIQGAVVLQHGHPEPWLSTPIVAETEREIRAASQSVYIPVPVNTILDRLRDFSGRVAYVGLPDQVASIRRLQQLGHPTAAKIEFVIGPYVGTAIYLEAIRSYLSARGIDRLEQLAEVRYREGEWPGNLYLRTIQGAELRSPKFYYNYLIPFFITKSSLLSMDFTNELTDVSVGDAWSPELEQAGGGHSVVLARSERGVELLEEMARRGELVLQETPLQKALGMHGHMLDFKKRGSYIRIRARRALGRAAPHHGIRPARVPLTRVLVEIVVSGLFMMGRTALARRLLRYVPLALIGPLFNRLRLAWKQLSKPTKRAGLWTAGFEEEQVGPKSCP